VETCLLWLNLFADLLCLLVLALRTKGSVASYAFRIDPTPRNCDFCRALFNEPLRTRGLCSRGRAGSLRNIQFEYRTDIPVTDSQAHKLEVWIPLPREDG
jgi:hypothetical protein